MREEDVAGGTMLPSFTAPSLETRKRRSFGARAGEELTERRTMACRRCHMGRVFTRRTLNMKLHFLLALITFGLWFPVWGTMIILQAIRPWTCTFCGGSQRN